MVVPSDPQLFSGLCSEADHLLGPPLKMRIRRFSYPGTKREEEGRRSKEGEAAEMLRKEKAKAKKRQEDGERLRNRLYTALYDNRALEKKKILAFGKVTEPKTDEPKTDEPKTEPKTEPEPKTKNENETETD